MANLFNTIGGLTGGLQTPQNQNPIGPGYGNYGQQDVYRPPTPQGEVLGASTSGGGNVWKDTSQAPMEQAPQQPSINWDEIYQPAFDALNQAEQAQQSGYVADVANTENTGQSQIAGLRGEEKARLNEYGQQRTSETNKTEGAIAAARRMASQILQGLQAQYGGSTGTGAFRGELLGSAASSNINNNKVALQTALTGIANSESALKDKVLGLVNEAENWVKDTKLKLKAGLDQALASIAQTRGTLNVDKGRQRADALQQYQQQLQAVEARNTQFKQQLYMEAQQQTQKLQGLKQTAQDKWNANVQLLQTAGLTPGQPQTIGGSSFTAVPTPSGGFEYIQASNEKDDQLANPFI